MQSKEVARHHVVLIHGTWANGGIWREFAEALRQHGFTVHAPTLRHHELPLSEGAAKLGRVSLSDYVDDLGELISQLDSPPIIVGHSLGGFLAQHVASRHPHKALVLLAPGPLPGIFGAYPSSLRIFAKYFLRWGFWRKPVLPPSWETWIYGITNEQPVEIQREHFAQLCADSGRVYYEMVFWFLDRQNRAKLDHTLIRTPVLVFGGSKDRAVHPNVARATAALYPLSTHVQLEESDHLMVAGRQAHVVMAHVIDWLAGIRLLPSAADI
ncbi:alpha/beta fold hydrolase [Pseudomonas sp. P1B16]|uniref:Alpha/beta hydrolase n=2 Tax=Pseudomonas TaxID=286 RepID=A0A6G6ISF1_PSENT|nr:MULTISPECIES: alpha/beta fold hydrolase [Pseudomonas]KYO75188.1 Pyrethroid hydrolase [Pseudomonas aeruginosa]NWD83124.1 alpha/beta fold hydrolase [Pseudomonas reactans]NWE92353.1 alpha/beta fold hydrolase [Pseudomonas reactans]QIE86065.1 alpha/beta hydrolase [Pseudomonas nitroreducens]WPM25670.1 alpha/beta fold hydrolase [Pseudomonas sp. P1B16]